MRFEESAQVSIGVHVSARGRVILGAESYRRLAEANAFRQENLEKMIRLGQVMLEVNIHPVLSERLALKGGTALNLMSDPIRRLSVHLDFNYVGSVGRERMLEDKPKILEAFRTVALRLDYSVDAPRNAHGGSKFSLRYRNSLGTRDQIQIDVNWITRVPLGPLQQRALWQPQGQERPIVKMVSTEELVAGKLRALTDRGAARDVYDAGFLPGLFEEAWPTPRAKALFVLFSGTLDYPLTRYSLDRLDRLTESEFQNKLVPVLNQSAVPDRRAMIDRAKAVLAPMLDLEANQVEYVERIQRGEYRPELVLPFDEDLAAALRHHPALMWKAQNAAAHHAKKYGGS